MNEQGLRANLPSVERLLRSEAAEPLIASFGRPAVTEALRGALAELRVALGSASRAIVPEEAWIIGGAAQRLADDAQPSLRRVFNLTGTVLHTNLGRAVLPQEAIDAVAAAAQAPANLEYDLAEGRRGERDAHIERLLCRLTGAEAATAVNNNAAAVLLVLNTLANRKEVPTSRGELIEIGGAFRMPDIMARAGTRLVEVGTTNRTHLRDYQSAIDAETALLMKVHTSNYLIQGFTAEVPATDLAPLAREKGLPLVDDLGSGTLVDLAQWGLKRERTVMDAVRDGADIVTFSGDKLLGGAQAGFIVGRRDLVQRCAKNPMKRAMRLDKIRLAALEATLKLYRDPDRLPERLPTLRLLTRSSAELETLAERLVSPIVAALDGFGFEVDGAPCSSQIGSGALPLETIPSFAVRIAPLASRKDGSRRIQTLAAAFRALPIPVIGRIEKGALLLDLRCLDDERVFTEGLAKLDLRALERA
jgi:L-seryl-tRNA(Ser) seleniumtransferase